MISVTGDLSVPRQFPHGHPAKRRCLRMTVKGRHYRLRNLHRTALAAISAATASVIFLATSCDSGDSSTAPKSSPETTRTQQTSSSPKAQSSSSLTTAPTESESGSASPTTGTQYLSDLQPLSSSSGADTGSAEVNGQNYAHSIFLRVDKGYIPENDAEYNLARPWRTFEVTIGLRDDAPTGCQLRFEAFADGKQISDATVSLGEARDLKLDISRVLRLKIQVTYVSPTDISSYCYGVWGDARLAT
ncbi:NPCBM/NEW2 domain-containing protein [Streptomyces sp. NPDC006372]|uniref:NPCBM/NEW2 domain-containing protein n=1 Tax=Streptomyces sp. NPDC006372 TaxID=3155599 RepID=UPI0033AB0273